MRLLVIIIFIILAGPLIRAQTISHDSLEGTKWILTSIDSAGTILTMPINPHYFVYFNAFENSKWKYKRRYKKIVRKYGYKEMAVFTEETNRSSKYFCQIRGLYKISSYNLLYKFNSYWNDNFKVQERLIDLEGKYISWLYIALNGQGTYKFTETGLDILIWKFKDEYVMMTLHLERLK